MNDVTGRVRAVLASVAPAWAAVGEIAGDRPLGRGGLGLDSVTLVELLVACEREFRVPFPDRVFEGSPLTVDRLAAHVLDARGRS